MRHLRALEDQSVYILREAYHHFDDLAMLWSMGKDSTVLLWLARKAFFGHVPFPLVHVDTGYEMPELIDYRDRLCREWRLNLVVGQNREALAAGMNHTVGRVTCCSALKIDALKQTIATHGWTAVILGIRADEEGTRAKERYFSLRDKHGEQIFATSRLNSGINTRRRFLPDLMSAFIRCWTGRNSTYGNTSIWNGFLCLICTSIAARAPATAVSAAGLVRAPSLHALPRSLRSSRSYGARRWLNGPVAHKTKAAGWKHSGN